MPTFLLTWFQRLNSVKWAMAYTQIGVIGILVGKLIVDFKSKDIMSGLSDIQALPTDFSLLAIAIGWTHHSNEIAVADPNLPKITGTIVPTIGK